MKNNVLKLMIISLFSLVSAICYAETSTLTSLLNTTHSLQANFTQTVYDNKEKAVQKSYGNMSLERPGKFRWEITKPIPQLIVANQTRLWIYDPDLEQVTVRTLKQAAGETPALFLSHTDQSIEQSFATQELNKNISGWRWFLLTPKKADSMFASMEIGFVGNEIREMRLKDHLGHTTAIKFENIKRNANLPASLFNFKPPAKVDVIDETRQS